MNGRLSRRGFLGVAAAGGAGLILRPERTWGDPKSPNEKINVAFVGAGGRAEGNIGGVAGAGENIVALCDIDGKRAAKSFAAHPKAKQYVDFRKMLEECKEIDAVVVSTPDHTHAVASVMAMRMGKPVYCEKPLTHSVYEARLMKQIAAEKKLATQMGNQGTSGGGLREAVEVIQAGTIGNVREVHCWTNRPIWPQGHKRPAPTMAPEHVNWDLFLGPAPEKPYASGIHPFAWRGYWDYGTGALGDMACHTANMAFMANKLGYPTSVVAESAPVNEDTFPAWATVTYEFPARPGGPGGAELPPLKWIWYEGKRDGKANLPADEITAKLPKDIKKSKDGKMTESLAGSGSLMIGDKGWLYSPSDYGGSYVLLPKAQFEGFKPPSPTLARSPGHYKEWFNAIRGGPAAMSNFDYAAFLTEVVVLGNVAVKLGKKVEWDGPNMKCTNLPEAAAIIKPEFRKGWEL